MLFLLFYRSDKDCVDFFQSKLIKSIFFSIKKPDLKSGFIYFYLFEYSNFLTASSVISISLSLIASLMK